jgi:hypothetical protein
MGMQVHAGSLASLASLILVFAVRQILADLSAWRIRIARERALVRSVHGAAIMAQASAYSALRETYGALKKGTIVPGFPVPAHPRVLQNLSINDCASLPAATTDLVGCLNDHLARCRQNEENITRADYRASLRGSKRSDAKRLDEAEYHAHLLANTIDAAVRLEQLAYQHTRRRRLAQRAFGRRRKERPEGEQTRRNRESLLLAERVCNALGTVLGSDPPTFLDPSRERKHLPRVVPLRQDQGSEAES